MAAMCNEALCFVDKIRNGWRQSIGPYNGERMNECAPKAGDGRQVRRGRPQVSPEMRQFFSHIGRLGCRVHTFSRADAMLGVKVRKLKRDFMRQGFSAAEALRRARAAAGVGK